MRASVRCPESSRPRLLAAAMATAAVAALSLTACGGSGKGEGLRQEGAASPQASAPAGQAPASAAQPSGSAGAAGPGASSAKPARPAASTAHGPGGKGGASRDPYAPENRVPCTAAMTEVVAAPLSRPLNHLLLTVTNKGSKMCELTGYPIVKFEGAQSVPPVIEESKPQAVTSLPPGGKGYAGVILSAGDGSAGEGWTARSLRVGFQGSERMADAALQAKGVHVDSSLRVTYWVAEPGDAVS
ncbi:DUF4232 domain-containing protein [Streptomyces abikoensis]